MTRRSPDSIPDGKRACLHCGAHVSPGFRRVFGDSQNRAHRCPECIPHRTMLADGAARDPEYDTDGYSEHRSITAGATTPGRRL